MPGNPNPLNQFEKGRSGNPKGRPPKEWTMTGLYKEAGEEETETGEPRKKIVARKLWEKAQKGDVLAIKELGNRIDGMPKQSMDWQGVLEVVPILGGHALPSNHGDQEAIEAKQEN